MTLQDQIIEIIEKIQSGHYDKTDISRYDPKITGHGVTAWKLSFFFVSTDPKDLVDAIKSLRDAGRLEVIDPDVDGLVSFRVPETNAK